MCIEIISTWKTEKNKGNKEIKAGNKTVQNNWWRTILKALVENWRV